MVQLCRGSSSRSWRSSYRRHRCFLGLRVFRNHWLFLGKFRYLWLLFRCRWYPDLRWSLVLLGDLSPKPTYFPLLVPECLLIEPTETEAVAELDTFIDAMVKIKAEAQSDPDLVRTAPHTLPVRRLDDVRAARELDLAWRPEGD